MSCPQTLTVARKNWYRRTEKNEYHASRPCRGHGQPLRGFEATRSFRAERRNHHGLLRPRRDGRRFHKGGLRHSPRFRAGLPRGGGEQVREPRRRRLCLPAAGRPAAGVHGRRRAHQALGHRPRHLVRARGRSPNLSCRSTPTTTTASRPSRRWPRTWQRPPVRARTEYCMVGYPVLQTLSDHAAVTRAICAVDAAGFLEALVEGTKVESAASRRSVPRTRRKPARPPRGRGGVDELLGVHPLGVRASRAPPHRVSRGRGRRRETSECLIPVVIGEILREKAATVRVLPTSDRLVRRDASGGQAGRHEHDPRDGGARRIPLAHLDDAPVDEARSCLCRLPQSCRPRSRGRGLRARAREPDWRAHRLQRRLRSARRRRPGRGRRRPPRSRRHLHASRRRPGRPLHVLARRAGAGPRTFLGGLLQGGRLGALRRRDRRPGLRGRRHRRHPSGRGIELLGGLRGRDRPGPAALGGFELPSLEIAQAGARGRERVRRRRLRNHGPDGLDVRRAGQRSAARLPIAGARERWRSRAGLKIVVVNSGVHHSLASSEYNKRRAECEEGVRILASLRPGVRSLRDVGARRRGAVLRGCSRPSCGSDAATSSPRTRACSKR